MVLKKFGLSLARSANVLIALGEEKATKLLLSRVTGWGYGKGFCVNERIAWLCRLVYEPKPSTGKTDPKMVMTPGGPVPAEGVNKPPKGKLKPIRPAPGRNVLVRSDEQTSKRKPQSVG